MSHPTRSSPLRLFAGAALLFAAGLAQAQYAWIDANGTRQYSDRPPPPSTPAARILKAPQPAALLTEAPAAPAPAAEVANKKGPPSLAERDADFRKRQQDQARQEQKAADDAQRREAQAENCASARQYKAQLQSGIRVADTAANGERTFISDQDRAARLAKTNRILEACR
ncbi:MAG: DUF4124 domain-containing protein [Massilia sp.]